MSKYRGLKLKEITEQLNIDQFTRLCNLIDEKVQKGAHFEILSIRPFRDDKDNCRLSINVLVEGSKEVRTLELLEKN